jgi:phage shock protein PspC (stress-responsive transcriptional regulator)
MEHPAHNRLTRSHDRILGGVAGGLADYFGLDPTIVRLLFVLAVVFGLPLTLLAYLVLWIIMPPPEAQASQASQPPPAAEQHPAAKAPSNRGSGLLLGIVLIVIGVLFLLPRVEFLPWFGWGFLHLTWPLVLILLGVLLLTRSGSAAR